MASNVEKLKAVGLGDEFDTLITEFLMDKADSATRAELVNAVEQSSIFLQGPPVMAAVANLRAKSKINGNLFPRFTALDQKYKKIMAEKNQVAATPGMEAVVETAEKASRAPRNRGPVQTWTPDGKRKPTSGTLFSYHCVGKTMTIGEIAERMGVDTDRASSLLEWVKTSAQGKHHVTVTEQGDKISVAENFPWHASYVKQSNEKWPELLGQPVAA